MVIAVRVVLGLIAAFFIVFGLRFVLTPDAMATEFFVTPAGIAGLSTVRADLGGAFFGIGACITLGLFTRATRWLDAAALIIGTIAVARLVGISVDGAPRSAVVALIVEVVFVILLVVGTRRLATTG